MPRAPKPPPPPRCTAILWNSGDPCEHDAAPGALFCPAHLALLPGDQWASSGYAAKLSSALQPLAQAAGFIGLSEEIKLARLHLLSLIERQASGTEVVAALNAVARLIRFHRELEADVLKSHHAYEYRRDARLANLRG